MKTMLSVLRNLALLAVVAAGLPALAPQPASASEVWWCSEEQHVGGGVLCVACSGLGGSCGKWSCNLVICARFGELVHYEEECRTLSFCM